LSVVGLKKIRVPKEFIEASWGTFFQDQGIELVEVNLEESNPEVPYQIIDSILPEAIDSVNPEKNLLLNPQVKNFLKLYFESGKDFDLVENFCASSKELFSIKIHDCLNIGHFIDAIVVEAYKNEFQVNQIRGFLNACLSFSFQVLQNEKELAPMEMTFGCTKDGFAFQLSVTAKNFQFDKNLRRLSSFLNITEYKKKSQYTISALWFKDDALKDLHMFFNKKQYVARSSLVNVSNMSPVCDAETISFDPGSDAKDSSVRISDSANNEGDVRISGSKSETDDVIRISGSGANSAVGNMKVSSNKSAVMEQQMLRMKNLLYKMKEELSQQKIAFETAHADSNLSSPELHEKISEITLENSKLQDEKKYLTARLQLANRKLQIMDNNLDKTAEFSRPNPEQEKELETFRQQNAVLAVKIKYQDEKLAELEAQVNRQEEANASPQAVDTVGKDLEITKLNEIKVLYENKMKEQMAENKKLDGRVKVLATQLDGALKKLSAPAPGMKTNENHAKQLEHASNRVAEVTKEYNDKKKEVIQVKQENEKLLGKMAELEKKIARYEKKAA
jgi:hypothetical protein